MALNYLLSPEFQIVNSAGRPASNGYLEVFYHGTRDRYYCASDFNGTLHPFQVPLDSLGGNVVLADDSHAYDVYIYNRYGSLLMSRYNIHPSSGGSMGGVITSSDGSVTVTPTQDGWDLSVDDGKAATFRAAADSLSADGYFSFRKIEGEGDAIYLDNGQIKMDDGWYHFSATVKLTWYGANVNDTSTVRLYSGATYDVIDFDYSYNHSDTVVLDGDIWIGAHSTHYISFGRNFSLGVTGMRQGMVAELVDCDLHSIIGQGVGGNGEKNIHRLLRYYTNANEADAQHPAGDWLHDLDAEDPSDPSGHPMVTADQLFEWYDEGQIFELYEVDGSNGQLGWSAVYRMVTWQDQSDWWSQFAPVPGKACRLEFYRMGGYSSINRGMMIAYIRYKEEDYMRLYQIMPGQDVWTMDFQPELTAGSNISISGSTISATDTTYTAGTGLSLTGTEFSADTSVLATQSDLAGKQDVLTAGQNITIDSSNVISATDTTYTAGNGIDITGTTISADTSVVATQSDLAGKQDTLTAGSNITIQNNVISASAAPQVQANWNESDPDAVSYIQNKPDLSIYAESANLATVATTGDYDDLTDKPDLSVYAEKADLATVATTGDYTDLTNKPTIPTVDQVYDGTSTNAQSGTAVAGAISTKQDTISDLNTIRSGAQAGATAVQPGDLATVATTGSYTDLTNKPDLSVYAETADLATVATTGSYNDLTDKPTIPAAQVNSDWNASSGVAQILNKPDLSVYATQNDLAGKQDTLTAGSNISISNNVISATDTTYSAGTGIDITGTTISADTSVLATQSELSSKQDTLTAGTNIQINGTTISATDTTYSAGTGIDITGTTISADTSVLATQNDLSSKQDTLTAGSNITISNNTISATDTTYSAGTGLTLTGTTFSNSDPLPAHTSSDEGKILKVDSNGDLEWGAESGGTVTDVQVNGTSVVSGGVADITVPAAQVNSDWTATSGVAEILHKPTEKTLAAGSNITITDLNDTVTISSTDPLPAHTSSDEGKVLGVDSNGDLEWTAGGGAGGADWDATSGEPGYIENKPTPKVLTAGANISISETASALTISAAAGLPASTSADEGKCLVVDSNGDPEWGTGGKTYTGTDGVVVDNVNDTVGLEAPVDIVAGPGIAIDNPDGNTVRVSANTDSFFKELYYNATNTNDTAGKVYALSEPITNFMYAKITVDNMEYTNAPLVYEIDVQHNTTTCQWNSPLRNGNTDNTINLPTCQLKINASGNLVLVARGLVYNTYPSPLFTNGGNRGMRVVRVVGIFRIAGGN